MGLSPQSAMKAESRVFIKRYYNERGWNVPWVKKPGYMDTFNKHYELIDGLRVQISSIKQDVLDRETESSMIPSVLVSGDSAIYGEVDAKPAQVTQYDINGVPFCYLVLLQCYGYSAAGSKTYQDCSVPIAYYDEKGYGLFQVFEPVGASTTFHPRLPDWTKNFPNR
jgi:hypothetical protein